VTSIGLNLAGISYWSNETPFVDRFKTADPWAVFDSNGNNITTSTAVDQNGYVVEGGTVATFQTAVGMDPGSAATSHEYVLTFSGTASAYVNGGHVENETANSITFTMPASSDEMTYAVVKFSNLNAADPVHDIHLVRADQQNLLAQGEIFNPDFIHKISQFDVVRFMDWGLTNSISQVSWASHSTTNDLSWMADSPDGVPLEAMVKLCNEAHVDMWYNVPTTADDAYVTQAMAYIRDHLSPDLKVHVEWSNEVWNTGFPQWQYAQQKSAALWGASDAWGYYGYRSAQVAAIAHNVFGAGADSRLVDVLAGQAAWTAPFEQSLVGVARANVGSVNTLFKDYAIAPYFGGEFGGGAFNSSDEATILGWARSGAAGLDAAFHELEFGGSLSGDESLRAVEQWIAASADAADHAGLNLVAYEGGNSLQSFQYASSAEQDEIATFYRTLAHDPRMGDLYTKLVADFVAEGGDDFVAFNDVGLSSKWGSWGVLDSVYQSGSPRYDALLAARNLGPSSAPVVGQTQAAPSAGGLLVATAGDDTVSAATGNDTIEGVGGNDRIVGSSSSTDGSGHYVETDYYCGGVGADTIIGGDGNDHIFGNDMSSPIGAVDGADSLLGGAGNDYIQGNAGADTIDGGSGNDRVFGGADSDSVMGGIGNDYLQGNKGADTLVGGDGNDTIHGGFDDDQLVGGSGNDLLYGDNGNDALTGGSGIDTMSGGSGNDTFVFAAHDADFSTTGNAAYTTDEVTDFVVGADKFSFGFHIDAVLQGSGTSLADAVAAASQQLASHAGQHDVAAITVGTDMFLFYDGSGAGGALNAAIKVDGLHGSVLSVNDFIG
jgi:Ca2+-binding RTX toxin-like protein